MENGGVWVRLLFRIGVRNLNNSLPLYQLSLYLLYPGWTLDGKFFHFFNSRLLLAFRFSCSSIPLFLLLVALTAFEFDSKRQCVNCSNSFAFVFCIRFNPSCYGYSVIRPPIARRCYYSSVTTQSHTARRHSKRKKEGKLMKMNKCK